jgi:hypothetical protein
MLFAAKGCRVGAHLLDAITVLVVSRNEGTIADKDVAAF